MTQTIDAPSNGNSESSNDLALATQQQPQQSLANVQQRMPVNPAFGNRGIEIQSFEDLWKLANVIARSPFAPKGMERPETIFVAIQLGLEVGMTPMCSMQSIAVINGRPGIYGDAALALVRGSGLCDYYLEFPSDNAVHALVEQLAVALEFGDVDDTKAIRKQIAAATARLDRSKEEFGYTSISKRAKAVTSTVRRFTVADAKKSGLWGKQGPWTQYSERMLMWRSRGFNLRDNFGDVLKGMYTAEEAQDLPPITLPGPAALAAASLPLNERVKAARDAVEAGTSDAAIQKLNEVETTNPVGAGESLDTTTGEVQQASEEDHAQPAPPTESQLSPKEQFDIHMKELMEAGGYDPKFFTNSLKKFLLSKGKVGKGHELTGQERAELETNIKGKLFGFSTEV